MRCFITISSASASEEALASAAVSWHTIFDACSFGDDNPTFVVIGDGLTFWNANDSVRLTQNGNGDTLDAHALHTDTRDVSALGVQNVPHGDVLNGSSSDDTDITHPLGDGGAVNDFHAGQATNGPAQRHWLVHQA